MNVNEAEMMSLPLPTMPFTLAFQLQCWQLSHLQHGIAVSPCFPSLLGPDQAATMSFASCSSPAHPGQAHQSRVSVVSISNWGVCVRVPGSPVNCSESQMDLSTLLPVPAQPIPAS